MASFSNDSQEEINDAVQSALDKGCSIQEVMVMLAEIMIYIGKE